MKRAGFLYPYSIPSVNWSFTSVSSLGKSCTPDIMFIIISIINIRSNSGGATHSGCSSSENNPTETLVFRAFISLTLELKEMRPQPTP